MDEGEDRELDDEKKTAMEVRARKRIARAEMM